MLRAGLIGFGVMGRNHARVLASIEGVDLVAIYDSIPNAVGAAPGVLLTDNFYEFLNSKLDYCVVACPTFLHAKFAIDLANAGIHCLIEKPIAGNLAEAKEIHETFRRKGLIGAVGHIERFNPALQILKEKLNSGLIGEIIQITTSRQGPYPGRIADVGVVKDLASHDIDLTSWICDSDFTQLQGLLAHKSGRTHEDLLIAIGKLSNGAVSNHVVNWISPFKERKTSVLGTKGLLVADTLNVDLYHFENGQIAGTWSEIQNFKGVSEGDSTKFALNRKEPLVSEHEAFRTAVISGDYGNLCTIAQGVEVIKLAEAVVDHGFYTKGNH